MIGNGNGGVNILSKIDKSLVGTPAGPAVRKVERYDWTTGGSVGSFAWIKKTDLNIDGRYQRDQVGEGKVRDIASRWDWLLIGTLSVIEREDGTYWVFDGGHRTRAAFYRDDVELLPCMVHKIASVNEEAKAFVARNTMVSNVSAFDRFHAAVCADEPVAQATNNILQELGLVPIKGGVQVGRYISCIGALQNVSPQTQKTPRRCCRFVSNLLVNQLSQGGCLRRCSRYISISNRSLM